MAKKNTILIKLVSTAKKIGADGKEKLTGYFYVIKKNPKKQVEKLSFMKYDPIVRKHVEFKEAKIK